MRVKFLMFATLGIALSTTSVATAQSGLRDFVLGVVVNEVIRQANSSGSRSQSAGRAPSQQASQSNGGALSLNAGQIADAQRALSRLGYNPGPADGIAGPRTIEAIRAFQRSLGADPTGVLTESQRAGLMNATPARQASTRSTTPSRTLTASPQTASRSTTTRRSFACYAGGGFFESGVFLGMAQSDSECSSWRSRYYDCAYQVMHTSQCN